MDGQKYVNEQDMATMAMKREEARIHDQLLLKQRKNYQPIYETDSATEFGMDYQREAQNQ